MDKWAKILLAFLIIAVAIVITFTIFIQAKAASDNTSNVVYPFSGNMDPTTGIVTLTDSSGNPQISCANKGGGTINIIASFTDIIDPYGTCSPASNDLINVSCGIPQNASGNNGNGNKNAKPISCSTSADCGVGMNCLGNLCQPGSISVDPKTGLIDSSKSSCGGNYCPLQPGTVCGAKTAYPDCNDPTGSVMTCTPNGLGVSTCQVNKGVSCMAGNLQNGRNTCAIFPLCSNASLDKTVLNNSCAYNNPNTLCRPRDSSAYLASHCNGKSQCDGTYDLTSTSSPFGPLPCHYNTQMSLQDFVDTLPISPGSGGNYSQGFYVHGLYSCINPK